MKEIYGGGGVFIYKNLKCDPFVHTRLLSWSYHLLMLSVGPVEKIYKISFKNLKNLNFLKF